MKKIFFYCLFLSGFVEAQQAIQPYGATPSERQLAWHDTEVYGLIHFTPTTFEDKEWGYGDADPKIFNPTHFDAEQIVKAAKAGGLKGVILVAKHHDGFALWPTKTTSYNISKSPFKNGKGDMVKEMQLAAQKYGLKFGVYCSPWDRNNPLYGTNKYLSIYQNQLKELYSQYGNLFMSWHDGANGGDGYYGGAREKRNIDNTTYYDWKNTWAITRKMQPMANIFSDVGLDIRWVGNEGGYAAETSWATFTPAAPQGKNEAVPGQANYPESPTGIRNGKFWMPAECDVPLRKGWFFHAQEKPKSPEILFDLYLKSVGRGAGLDLGLAPDSTGQLHADDVVALQTFGTMVKETFAHNLAKGATVQASNTRDKTHAATTLLDGDKQSFWATEDKVHEASLEINLPSPRTFDIISLQEFIPLGQRIEAYYIEVFKDNTWKKIYEGTSIGAKRLIKLDKPITTSKLRLNITKSPVCITLSEIGLYKQANL
ncbi:alpha-L-fucosidase [Chryseobacterium lactis]|uniref:alpha-L-fucosidase n=1 Tax=Chryseobacterium lactis TaxID=1241981 RepID=A0A3G6RQZ9_CHRLC|nr:alpha-L-fucosidase [Chryseobacterium lactis]AZA80465.1 alpha-L-fucosidase [Chryseobacterium lactis]AZB05467.1 alpha-L-fucosidase [Chryseobacterium lactis]PNW11398.1 alpha-L-fucosidase [Chryseobacterium lactis]